MTSLSPALLVIAGPRSRRLARYLMLLVLALLVVLDIATKVFDLRRDQHLEGKIREEETEVAAFMTLHLASHVTFVDKKQRTNMSYATVTYVC